MLCRFALGTRAQHAQVIGIKVFKSAAQGGADADDVTVGSFRLINTFSDGHRNEITRHSATGIAAAAQFLFVASITSLACYSEPMGGHMLVLPDLQLSAGQTASSA